MPDNWGLEGQQLSYKSALALCYVVGFRGHNLTRAVAVMTAESARYTEAWHLNDNSTVDRGLWQINDIHRMSEDDRNNPYLASIWAFRNSKGVDFTPWAAFNSGAYKKFVPLVLAAKLTGWRRFKKLWE